MSSEVAGYTTLQEALATVEQTGKRRGRPKGSKTVVNWQELVERVRTETLPFFERESGSAPSLRMVFYNLVSQEINPLPNTDNYYKTLSTKLTEARKDGRIPFEALEDRNRYSILNFSDEHLTKSRLDDVRDNCAYRLENLDIDTLLYEHLYTVALDVPWKGYWARQPIIPEIWVEKDALAPTIANWVSDLEVDVRVCKGYTSTPFLYENAKALRERLDSGEHENGRIYYITDLDPTGKDTDRHIIENLEFFGLTERVEFVRLALTPEQVEEYNLPPMPTDKKTLEKLKRDPRAAKYREKYVTEVDALLAVAPGEFRSLIRDAITSLHDEEIHESVKQENREIAEMSRKMREKAIEDAKRVLMEQMAGGDASGE